MNKLIIKLKELRNADDDMLKGRQLLFSNSDLKKLIIPLVIEQMLTMMVGVTNTMMISYAGEAAVSGVSLVEMINNLFIFVFSALATGGAVVVSQYLGSNDKERGCFAASQLVTVAGIISLGFMISAIIFNRPILSLLFGSVEDRVMSACITYFLVSALSYPFMAIYNSCAALFRSMGNSKVTMIVSLGMNVINVVGNIIAIFVLHSGILGVGIASLIARGFAAVIMMYLTLNKKNAVFIRIKEIFSWNKELLRMILHIAVPNGIENGLFQLSRIALVSMIALFGTAQISANGVANSIDYIGATITSAMSLANVTVVGRCVGANEYNQVIYYIKKLTKITYISSLILDTTIIILAPFILSLYALSDESRHLAYILIILHNVFIITIHPLSGPLSNALRAAGDVRYTMAVAIFATVICRILFALILGVWLNMGIIGIWISMGIDWGIRAVLFTRRYKSGKWKNFRMVQ